LSLLAALALLAACSPRFDWRIWRDAGLGYEVALPDRPQRVTRELPRSAGEAPLRLTMVSVGVGPSLLAVGSAPLPTSLGDDEARRRALLDELRDGLLQNVRAGAAREEPVPPPPGLAGRRLLAASAFRAEGRAGRDGRAVQLVVRLYVVEDRLYELISLGAEADLPAAERANFLDSFRLLAPRPS
jgi:hypothetical protein